MSSEAPQPTAPAGPRLHKPSAAVVALLAVAAVGIALVLGLLMAGARAGEGHASGGAAPNVIGMPVARAKAVLRKAGARRIAVVHVPYGEFGVVQRATGFEFDGTVNQDSSLRLLVGTKHLKSWSQTEIP